VLVITVNSLVGGGCAWKCNDTAGRYTSNGKEVRICSLNARSRPETQPDDATLAQRVGQAAPAIDAEAETELCRRLARGCASTACASARRSGRADLMQQVMVMMIEHLRAGALREPNGWRRSCSAYVG